MSVTTRVFDPAICCSPGVCGPLVEVPVLIALVRAALWTQRRCDADEHPEAPSSALAANGPATKEPST